MRHHAHHIPHGIADARNRMGGAVGIARMVAKNDLAIFFDGLQYLQIFGDKLSFAVSDGQLKSPRQRIEPFGFGSFFPDGIEIRPGRFSLWH